jgi:arylsulfatase A-like enzyme
MRTTRVPLVLMGPGIAPGEYVGRATPADLAPTLAHLLGVTLPHAQGRVLGEALTGIKSSPAGRSGPVDQSANRK